MTSFSSSCNDIHVDNYLGLREEQHYIKVKRKEITGSSNIQIDKNTINIQIKYLIYKI